MPRGRQTGFSAQWTPLEPTRHHRGRSRHITTMPRLAASMSRPAGARYDSLLRAPATPPPPPPVLLASSATDDVPAVTVS